MTMDRFSEKTLTCANCKKNKINSGYEFIDDNCNWYCSAICSQMYQLHKNYN